MKNKVISIERAVDFISDGMSVMIGGFAQTGSPRHLIRELSRKNVKNLHTISDDLGVADHGFEETICRLIDNDQICDAKCCFIGQNPQASKLYMEGKLPIEFIPMGTFIERIRCGGNGLGGFLTKTGVGTLVEEGKTTITIDGEKYLIERPIHADVALVKAYIADTMGNAIFKYTAQNHNGIMATAADTVILEAEKVVDAGELEPDQIQLPGIFVDYVVEAPEDIL
ncbi:MAG: CoA transferase subunit A [Lachnospiraceae bacterium]|jgi:acetate CoA/acetoacetate CoA-transferase alpha subunit|nr:CoA transferase subunit A [Lachnospiraceae bacterium]MCI1656863.1 CoA transferase subunit A [Lachnospiraceae bacterium]MCI2195131.1 CoA transferase subunit A [Lachnospiraceae bacterium]